MIQAIELTKRFGDFTAVDRLQLEVRAGEFFCFLGPNGAGKTTTIKMLTGLMKPTSGRALLGGYDIQAQPVEAKRLLSYVPDMPHLYDRLSPLEFFHFVGQLYEMDPTVLRHRVPETVELFGLQQVQNHLLSSLSHGTRQRVAIGAALLHDPKIFIIDEPMVGLDPRSTRLVKDIFRERARNGCTIFLSTHLLSVAQELADRIGIINHGRLVALGSLSEIRRQHGKDGELEELFLELTREEAAERSGAKPGGVAP